MNKREMSELKAAVQLHQGEAKMDADMENIAKFARTMFDAYMTVGFSEEQALYLTSTMMMASLKK